MIIREYDEYNEFLFTMKLKKYKVIDSNLRLAQLSSTNITEKAKKKQVY